MELQQNLNKSEENPFETLKEMAFLLAQIERKTINFAQQNKILQEGKNAD